MNGQLARRLREKVHRDGDERIRDCVGRLKGVAVVRKTTDVAAGVFLKGEPWWNGGGARSGLHSTAGKARSTVRS
jgi:hypothetical protein